MIRLVIFSLFVFVAVRVQAQNLYVRHLQCEYRDDPLGVESPDPFLHWELQSDRQNILQKAYRILVSDDSLMLNNNTGNIWDSGEISSDSSIQIVYKGKALKSAQKYFWKVMVWDNKGNHSAWSKMATWQMGLLDRQAWGGAKWIGYERLPDSEKIVPAMPGNGKKQRGKRPDILPLFHKSFSVSKKIKQATAFICGLGQFEMSINGKKVGDHFLDPGWTKYDKQALYVTFDITGYLQRGANAVGVMLGNGFYYIPGGTL